MREIGENRVADCRTGSAGHLDRRCDRRRARAAEDAADELDGLAGRVLRRSERRREQLDLAQSLACELGDLPLCAERQRHRSPDGAQLVIVLHAPDLRDQIVDRHRTVERADARDADPPLAQLAAGRDELRQPVEIEEAVVPVGDHGVRVPAGGLELVARDDERARAVLGQRRLPSRTTGSGHTRQGAPRGPGPTSTAQLQPRWASPSRSRS